jgi:oligopeptide transport system ATP-binding protein
MFLFGLLANILIVGHSLVGPHLPPMVAAGLDSAGKPAKVQAQVINLLRELQRDLGLSMIFIAHDLSVVKHVSDRIVVMYLGRLMETASAKTLTSHPAHPYTQALIASVPIPDPVLEKARHRPILQGELPSPINPPSGCVFRTRCPKARRVCADRRPDQIALGDRHLVACPFHEKTPVLVSV